MTLFRGRIAGKYIFFEMLPGFLMGVFIFVFILLMFQALRLTEFVLVHGVKVKTIGEIMLYLSISFIPAILPMSLLFAVLLTYGRLSNDSEIVAFKASGLHMGYLSLPAIVLAFIVAITSARTSFYTAPWGNRQFELIVRELGNTRAGATIREGTFSEGFFDLVVYANKVDSKTGALDKVFIYDERNEKQPVTIIAKKGAIIPDPNFPGHSAALRLMDGNIHRTQADTYTKIDFSSYDINLSIPLAQANLEKSPQSLTLDDIQQMRQDVKSDREKKLTADSEFHKRWAVSVVCVLFAILGVGLGTQTNKRSGKSNGLILSLAVIIVYWVFFVTGETLAKNGTLPPYIAYWIGNVLFLVAGIYRLRKVWN